MNGQFVLSLDFEKIWGVFDSKPNGDYQKNLKSVDIIIDRLLNLSDQYGIKLTFATVGFLFNKDIESLIANTPKILPTYTNEKLNPYLFIRKIKDFKNDDPQYFAYSSLQNIIKHGQHEIASHTYSHYYCLEEGQNLDQFEEDLKMAKKVAQDIGVDLKSIVFPRNQVNVKYLKVCKEYGFISYRGNENHSIYEAKSKQETKSLLHRFLRLADAYINITGTHSHNLNAVKKNGLVDITSSSFFRPYNKNMSLLEPLKVNRVKKSMTRAAKNKELFHIWFHPHNFGVNTDKNFNNLEAIFKLYSKLNEKYHFEAATMSEVALKLNS